MGKRKKMMVTSFSYPPLCSRCKKKVSCKVLQSGRMVCGEKSLRHKLKRVI